MKSRSVKIGQDMWKQLKRVSISVFSVLAYIDGAPAPPAEYKLLQLRQYLSGEALRCFESLGHSAIAYDPAKN